MSMPVHLELTGEKQGKIEGSCDMEGRAGTILVQSLDHEILIPRDPQSGSASGKRVHGAMKITKYVDKSTPKLFQALTSGEQLKEVKIKWYRINGKTGKEEHYFTTVLNAAIIVSINTNIPNCLNLASSPFGHMEDVSFTYRKIIWTWEVDGIESEDDWSVPRA